MLRLLIRGLLVLSLLLTAAAPMLAQEEIPGAVLW